MITNHLLVNYIKHLKFAVRSPALQRRLYSIYINSDIKGLRIMGSKKTIKDFGYGFNSEGKLRKLNETGELSDVPFQFNVSDNHRECQQHYEELGEAITEHVYKLLEKEALIKLPVPIDGTPESSTFIFVSKDYDKKEKLVVLIHGSGVVRAGQWARSLIINDSIETGTQIPYIRKAVAKNYGVIIMNSNDNTRGDIEISNSSTPEKHAFYVWNNYIMKTKAKNIAFIAHSYGGVVTLDLAERCSKEFEEHVKAVAFTDSVHSFSNYKVTPFLKEVAKNWVSSKEPLDKAIKTPDTDITRVSAGHQKHEMTSHSCMNSVFTYIEEKFNA